MTKKLELFLQDVVSAEGGSSHSEVIADELAAVRTRLRTCSAPEKPSLVAKVWYMSMTGANTQWANIEIANLMVSPRISYKRIAYMAAINTFDDNPEISVLITHTVAKDLANPDPLVHTLALTCLAQIGTRDMISECRQMVTQHADSANTAAQKRAAAVMLRAVRASPDLCEVFRPSVHKLLSSTSHGVVSVAAELAVALISHQPELPAQWAQFGDPLFKILKTLTELRPAREFEFGVFNDPFLQIRILRLLAALGRRDEALDDLLSAIVTGVDARRNTGRSLLFQCVHTIGACACKQSLRALSYNQVGRLFSFREPNVLYCALSAFSNALYDRGAAIDRSSADSVVLQRYKSQVVACLDHRDPSIRRRALDVVTALVDATNVETLIPEVMQFLHMADGDFRQEIVAKVFTSIQRFAPAPKWCFDTTLSLIRGSGSYVGMDVVAAFCRLVGTKGGIRAHALRQLVEALPENAENQALVQVAAWAVGEYAHSDAAWESMKCILAMPQTKTETAAVLMTAIAKLAVRMDMVNAAIYVVAPYEESQSLELQQRAGEIVRILKNERLREALLATVGYEEVVSGNGGNGGGNNGNNNGDDLLGLNQVVQEGGVNNGANNGVDSVLGATNTAANGANGANGANTVASNTATPGSSNSPNTTTPTTPNTQAQIRPPPGATEVLRCTDFVLFFEVQKNSQNPNQLAVRATVYGLGAKPLTRFQIQYGVPQGWGIQTQRPSGDVLEPIGGRPIVQIILIVRKGGVRLQVKARASFMYLSQPLTQEGVISGGVFD